MKPTIYDIAKKTGFSAPSISKVLNGKGSLSKANQELILKTAKELGYRPNLAARSLITKKSNMIGVIFNDPYYDQVYFHPVYNLILNRVRKNIAQLGYDLLYLSNTMNETGLSFADHCVLRNVDAVLLASSNCTIKDLDEMSKLDIPCISLNDMHPGLVSITTDNIKAGFDVTEYLIKQGHTDIAFFDVLFDYEKSYCSRDRKQGYYNALDKYNIKKSYIQKVELWDEQSGYNAIEDLLKYDNNVTAVFTSSDRIAMGVYEYCKDHNVRIPEDLSIIGFDDNDGSKFTSPKLTTVAHGIDETIAKTIEVLIGKIEGKYECEEEIKITSQLVIRESVKKRN